MIVKKIFLFPVRKNSLLLSDKVLILLRFPKKGTQKVIKSFKRKYYKEVQNSRKLEKDSFTHKKKY